MFFLSTHSEIQHFALAAYYLLSFLYSLYISSAFYFSQHPIDF